MPFFERNQCPKVERIISSAADEIPDQFLHGLRSKITAASDLFRGKVLIEERSEVPSQPYAHRGI